MPRNEQHISTEQQFVPLTYVGPYVLPILAFWFCCVWAEGLKISFSPMF